MTIENSRILLVDDIEENLKVLSETLVHRGFKPLQARSGARALEIAAKAMPDLILLDIRMPDMDGFETIAALKAGPATRDIPVIFISALSDIEDKVQGFQAGAVDYISKPFREEEVIARVSTHLSLRHAMRRVEEEQAKSEKLLLNILPASVAQELKDTGSSKPQIFPQASILFTDFVNFTPKSTSMEPAVLISELNDMFTEFDAIIDSHGCQRIKTVGDAYIAVAGMPEVQGDHARRLTAAALDILAYLEARNRRGNQVWEARAGIHSGEVVGAIVGTSKYLYDIFGDAVNIASRVEGASKAGHLTVSEATWKQLGDAFSGEARGEVDVKGKGSITMYFVTGKK